MLDCAKSSPNRQGIYSSKMPVGASILARRKYGDILLNMKIRLFIDKKLASNELLELEKSHTHYIKTVLRGKDGREVFVFNPQDGEWRGLYREHGRLELMEQTIAPVLEAQLALIFAPIKFGKIDFMVQKAISFGKGS